MKPNIIKGVLLIGAIALASCSTQNKLSSGNTTTKDATNDDVYYTKAKAGDQVEYAARQDAYSHSDNNNGGYDGDDDDYYYYDSYAARINRFYNYSPFISSYYSDLYYGYSPYYSGFGFGFGLGWGGGFGLGLGFGGYGFSPFDYYGYSPYSYYGYNPYGYYGYGYGGYGGGYWGVYSYGRSYSSARPYRGNGYPGSVGRPSNIGYAGNLNGRPTRVGVNTSGRPGYNNNNPQVIQQTRPQVQSYPSNQGQGNGGGNGGGGVRSGGGGRPGGRP
jgi:hypothetical protein